jgi:hypothetical protein
MAASVPSRAGSIPLNSHGERRLGVDRRCAKASIGVNSRVVSAPIETPDDVTGLVFAAIADAGLSDKAAALTMGLDPAQLSRAKSGQARLPVDALWRLPDAFWFAFRERVDAARQLSEDRQRDAKAARISELVRLLLEVA